MPQHQAASGQFDRNVNPADGVGSLKDGSRTHPAHAEGAWCISVPAGTAKMEIPVKDGSLHDETAVYSQHREFRLLSDHLIQKGPSFPQPLDMTWPMA